MWKKLKSIYSNVNFLAKFLILIRAPIPYLKHVGTILKGMGYAWEGIKTVIMAMEKKKSDTIIKLDTEAAKKIEAERALPIEQQNNEVLREAARSRHEKSK